jgi:hypothetical protein
MARHTAVPSDPPVDKLVLSTVYARSSRVARDLTPVVY